MHQFCAESDTHKQTDPPSPPPKLDVPIECPPQHVT